MLLLSHQDLLLPTLLASVALRSLQVLLLDLAVLVCHRSLLEVRLVFSVNELLRENHLDVEFWM